MNLTEYWIRYGYDTDAPPGMDPEILAAIKFLSKDARQSIIAIEKYRSADENLIYVSFLGTGTNGTFSFIVEQDDENELFGALRSLSVDVLRAWRTGYIYEYTRVFGQSKVYEFRCQKANIGNISSRLMLMILLPVLWPLAELYDFVCRKLDRGKT